jgi:hypothetical protein
MTAILHSQPVVDSEHFKAWDKFFGCVVPHDGDPNFPSRIYGWENKSNHGLFEGHTSDAGACFGFVQAGRALILSGGVTWMLNAGQFFETQRGFKVMLLEPETVVMAAQRYDYYGVNRAGGPIEALGRLKYIDGCSDTLLIGPQVKGEACINHLHFPTGIDQTEHTHPSSRIGIVARGSGECVTPLGATPLIPGRLFFIPKDGLHKFRTYSNEMDVIAYHPDTDFGPTHQEHPMVNRTLVGGQKIDNTTGVHVTAQVIEPDLLKARESARV